MSTPSAATPLLAEAERSVRRPPFWLVAATGTLALGTLAMAVAETSLWMHYLIDAGESISLAGLAFVLAASLYLYSRGQLAPSLPLTLPWLLFPVITQGDQIIDNLSITWMRVIVHVLLALLFGFPVAVVAMAARWVVTPGPPLPLVWRVLVPGLAQLRAGRAREGAALLGAMLLVAEMWVAVQFLGTLMVITLVLLVWGVLAYGFASSRHPSPGRQRQATERAALAAVIAGVVVSLGLFFAFKHRPGAYQGSPSYFMDPAQQGSGFQLDRVVVPAGAPERPPNADEVRAALSAYARAFDTLLAGYYVLDRNYNYDFHNRLFLRSTPLLPNYRAVGLEKVHAAVQLRHDADALAARARAGLPEADPLTALLDDLRAYAAFTFDRAPVLEQMSAGFEQTQAGLQHATHLFEGEGKVLGVRLAEILAKHHRVLGAPALQSVTAEFVTVSRSVHDAYANRIVGF